MLTSDATVFWGAAVEDTQRLIRVQATDGKSGADLQLEYRNASVAGNGSFGVVYQVMVTSGLLSGPGEVAIKKVLQDKRFKVCSSCSFIVCCILSRSLESRAADHALGGTSQRGEDACLLLFVG